MNVTGFLLFIGFGAAFTYLVVRSRMVTDFRRKWMDALKDDTDATYIFHRDVPSYARMLFSFRRLQDHRWIPTHIRMAKYRAELSPEVREKLDEFLMSHGITPEKATETHTQKPQDNE